MSDKTGEARSTHGGAGRILGGIAATALIGAAGVAAAAAAATPAATNIASAACSVRDDAGTLGSAIRDQFRESFTPGVVFEASADSPAIICDNSLG